MAAKIIWSGQARDDLQSIVLFIAQDNPPVAESFAFALMAKVDLLADFPLMGRVVPEQTDDGVRELIVRPYRVIYQVLADGNIIAILRVWHGARGEPEIPQTVEF